MLDGKNLLPYILEDKSDLREFGWRKRARNHDAGINFLNNEAYRYGDWKYVKVFEGDSKNPPSEKVALKYPHRGL